MSSFVNRCIFSASAGGLADFAVGSAVVGFFTPAQANAIVGQMYSYSAQITDLSEFEYGRGVWNGTTLERTTVVGSSNGNNKVNFSSAPAVRLTMLADDLRETLAASKTYYVATTGSDSNPGTQSLPWLTPQHAVDWIANNIDAGGHDITVQFADGEYEGPQIFQTPPNVAAFNFRGNAADRTAVLFNNEGNQWVCWYIQTPAANDCILDFRNMSFDLTVAFGWGSAIYAEQGSKRILIDNVRVSNSINDYGYGCFVNYSGGASHWQFGLGTGNPIEIAGTWDAAVRFKSADDGLFFNTNWTNVGTVVFTQAFIILGNACAALQYGGGLTGLVCTGRKFLNFGGTIQSNDAEFGYIAQDNFLPGSLPGITYAGTYNNRYSQVLSYGATDADRKRGGNSRIVLTEDTTFYVSNVGNNNNSGVTAGLAWATPQYAVDWIAANVDAAGFDIVVQFADGTYPGPVFNGLPLEFRTYTLQGNATTPANVIFNNAGDSGYACFDSAIAQLNIIIDGVTFDCSINSGFNVAVAVSGVQSLCRLGNVRFTNSSGAYAFACIAVWDFNATCILGFGNTPTAQFFSGNWDNFAFVDQESVFHFNNVSMTVGGSPVFADGFLRALCGSTVLTYAGAIYGATVTGQRFILNNRASVGEIQIQFDTGLNFFPGTIAGTAVASWYDEIYYDDNGIALNNRERLTADRTYYVRTDGNDANTGLANTAGGAFRTIQHAVDVVSHEIDFAAVNADFVIKIADGTYDEFLICGPYLGLPPNGNYGSFYSQGVHICGNLASPSSVLIQPSGAPPTGFYSGVANFNGMGAWELSGVKLDASLQAGYCDLVYVTQGAMVTLNDGGQIAAYGNVGGGGGFLINAYYQAYVYAADNMPQSLQGGTYSGLVAAAARAVVSFAANFTLTGNVTFTDAAFHAGGEAIITDVCETVTLGGFTITGPSYKSEYNSQIHYANLFNNSLTGSFVDKSSSINGARGSIDGLPSTSNLVSGGWQVFKDAGGALDLAYNDAGTIKKIGREKLTADRTYYVRTDGSDSNTGLVNSAGGAFLTIQHALNVIKDNLDLVNYKVTINIGAGTFDEFLEIGFPPNSERRPQDYAIRVVGQGATTKIKPTGTVPQFAVIQMAGPFQIDFVDIEVDGTTTTGASGELFYCAEGTHLYINNLSLKGTNAYGYAFGVDEASFLSINGNITIDGILDGLIYVITGSYAFFNSGIITFASDPNFRSGAAIYMGEASRMVVKNTFSGTATGRKYDLFHGAHLIATGGASQLPGTLDGTLNGTGHFNNIIPAGNLQPTTVREVLTADRTYYVRTDGSDSNTGLVNSAGGAWLTPQHAYDVIAGTLDFAGHIVTIQMGDGSYSGAGGTITTETSGGWIGGGQLVWQGNVGDPTAVTLATGGGFNDILRVSSTIPGIFRVKYMSMSGSRGIANSSNSVIIVTNVNTGSFSDVAFSSEAPGALVVIEGDYTISGGGPFHCRALYSSSLWYYPGTVTITGTPDFSFAFALAEEGGIVEPGGVSFSGSATGRRFYIGSNGVCYGVGLTFFPGDAAGTIITGGVYGDYSDALPGTVQSLAFDSASETVDYSLGGYVVATLSANVTTLTISNWHPNQASRLTLDVRNTGAFNITFPTGWLAAGGAAPTITSGSGKKDVIVLTTPDAGTTVHIHNVGQDFSAI